MITLKQELQELSGHHLIVRTSMYESEIWENGKPNYSYERYYITARINSREEYEELMSVLEYITIEWVKDISHDGDVLLSYDDLVVFVECPDDLRDSLLGCEIVQIPKVTTIYACKKK